MNGRKCWTISARSKKRLSLAIRRPSVRPLPQETLLKSQKSLGKIFAVDTLPYHPCLDLGNKFLLDIERDSAISCGPAKPRRSHCHKQGPLLRLLSFTPLPRPRRGRPPIFLPPVPCQGLARSTFSGRFAWCCTTGTHTHTGSCLADH